MNKKWSILFCDPYLTPCPAEDFLDSCRPVLSLGETDVLKGLEGLSSKGLARETHASGSRVPKYLHELLSRFDLSGHEMAVLCELMLRGPQTPGELRSNAGRMAPFANMGEAEEVLKGLMEHEPPFVTRLPRETGKKESRYVHLFSPPDIEEPVATRSVPEGNTLNDAMAGMEEEIAKLRKELAELRQEFEKFKSQF